MDTQSLQAFLAVADTQSFSRAAERLHLTQPAVSKRIATLETQLTTRLFDRIGRRIALTEAGHLLRPQAVRILEAMEDSRRALANLSGQVGGRLTLATSHHIGLHRLPPILKRYTRAHPDVALDLRFQDSELAYQDVLDGQVEIAVVTLSPTPLTALSAVELWRDRLCFVCAADHSLARLPKPLSLDTLCAFDCVLPGFQTFTHALIQRRFEQVGLALQVSVATNYLETLKMLCSVGLGWSVLPQGMVEGELIELEVDTLRLERPLGYLVHTRRTLSNAALELIDALESQG